MTLEDAIAELARTARIVEAPEGLWHLRARAAGATLCGLEAAAWPIVIRWEERSGITCGRCLVAAGIRPARRGPSRV